MKSIALTVEEVRSVIGRPGQIRRPVDMATLRVRLPEPVAARDRDEMQQRAV